MYVLLRNIWVQYTGALSTFYLNHASVILGLLGLLVSVALA